MKTEQTMENIKIGWASDVRRQNPIPYTHLQILTSVCHFSQSTDIIWLFDFIPVIFIDKLIEMVIMKYFTFIIWLETR